MQTEQKRWNEIFAYTARNGFVRCASCHAKAPQCRERPNDTPKYWEDSALDDMACDICGATFGTTRTRNADRKAFYGYL